MNPWGYIGFCVLYFLVCAGVGYKLSEWSYRRWDRDDR